MLEEGPRAHDLVLVAPPKADSGTEPDIAMESISGIDLAEFMSLSEMGISTVTAQSTVTALVNDI